MLFFHYAHYLALWNGCPPFRHGCTLKMWFTGTRWQFPLRAVQKKRWKGSTCNMQDFLENAHPSRKCGQHKVTETRSGGLIRVHNQQLTAARMLAKSFDNMSFLWTLKHQLNRTDFIKHKQRHCLLPFNLYDWSMGVATRKNLLWKTQFCLV